MSDISPENYAEFITQDGPESPSRCEEEVPRIEDLQPPFMMSDPRLQTILLPKIPGAVIDR
ncbi:hypothetical protein GCM10010112_68140 [Actinoplanes lobatus]|uniref:Uncharacterized protein n=3 Tax=Actinoplanes TaxID=1865 RepID=A0A7W5FJ73_9ACTN|nr:MULTISPECIES: hypothetical protein [Actinoplanes]MBB3100195.1 hypothetical protein [Actinoplanes campanulatus]MBB4749105.1 hypothetical protein [Actinoplanes lobatus]MBW6436635.1 hypothetical protein [Actinoplanes hulinensis]GGN28795.1 hypothetical protein GCM10010109_47300 [Actinoplanes campanulatus]GGN86489.1 hypothetical protein GCM10010112_68140 [Actinoplanes lobatus]